MVMNKEKRKAVKYYTPTIEEFHVGFEFECTTSPTKKDWYKDAIRNVDDMTEVFSYSEARVKYLDKEDIESFGFTVTHYNEVSIYGKVGGYQPYTIENFSLVENHIFEIKWQSSMGDVTLFRGIIKNKSEFSKLLKQLNIDL
jgi:nicotinic acid phosphoribosyltransferase